MRELTAADVYVENQLFATLDPTSRTLELPSGKEVVLTDTVGFIQNLPHDLVAAFRATLEEVCEADLVLHVVDSSSEMRNEQMKVVQKILGDLGAADKPQITVFNKKDCVSGREEFMAAGADSIWISAFSREDLDQLCEMIQLRLAGDTRIFALPVDRGI